MATPGSRDYCLRLFQNISMITINHTSKLCCPPVFDGFRAWSATPVNSYASQQCPDRYNNLDYNEKENATRFCTTKGEWLPSNYDMCIVKLEPKNYDVIAVWFTGYTLSTIALWIALIIFRHFRALRCLRNSIHVNLIISYIIRVMTWYFNFIPQLATLYWPLPVANIATALHLFAQTANFFWMFVEGIYLLVVIAWTYSIERFKIWHYCLIGWGIPFVLTSITTIFKVYALNNSTLGWINAKESDPIKFCAIHIPILISIIMNIFVTAFVVWTLVKKLRETKQMSGRHTSKFSIFSVEYRKAIKAAGVLIPLLGLSHILAMFEFDSLKHHMVYIIFSAILNSTQGFFVSLIYCFLNREVRMIVHARYRSCRGHLPTSSRVRQTGESCLHNGVGPGRPGPALMLEPGVFTHSHSFAGMGAGTARFQCGADRDSTSLSRRSPPHRTQVHQHLQTECRNSRDTEPQPPLQNTISNTGDPNDCELTPFRSEPLA